MAKRYFTILIVSHGRSRFRKVRISPTFVLALGAIALGLVGGALYAPSLLLRIETQAAQVEKLEQENVWLRSEKDQFETRLAKVSSRLNSFEARADRMATVLGVEELATDRPAVGGPSGIELGADPLWRVDLDSLNDRSDRVEASVELLAEAFEDRLARLAATPNVMPVSGWFSHGYGWRKDPFTGRRQFHRGVDIVADQGTAILASADGVVSRAERRPDYGKLVDLSHGLGYVTRYAHMSEILVRPGQRVRRGDVIGRVGSTGRSTGPHLHYEVHRDGRRVNPWKYLDQRGR